MKSIFTNEQILYLKENYTKMSYKEIANTLGFTERQVRGKINGLALTKQRKFNNKYFNEITHPNQAYWLGFIYADGYLVNTDKSSCELGIELQDTDIQLLECFNHEIGDAHTIYKKQDYKQFNGYQYKTDSCILRIYSKDIVNDLIHLSVYPNKTYRKEYPKCDKFFWDFFRGFNDGDGCLHIDDRNHMFVQLTNSNEDFLKYLNDTIYSLLNIRGSIYKEKDHKYRLVYFRKNDTKLLLDTIYKDENCTKLQRKYNIYKSHYGSPN
jgi:hypothetical protein